LVELVGSGGVGRGRDQSVFEFISKAWPVGILPAWSRFAVIGEKGVYEDKSGSVGGPRRGEGRHVPRVKGRKNMWVGERQVEGSRSAGPCEGKPGVDARGLEEGEAQICG